MRTIVQIEPQPWPSGYGDVLGVLDLTTEVLKSRYSLRFSEGSDNLGRYEAVPVQLPSGRRLGLLHHHRSPAAGVEVHGDREDNPENAMEELLESLGLSWEACSWMRQVPHHHERGG
jgi:hypothetical protein